VSPLLLHVTFSHINPEAIVKPVAKGKRKADAQSGRRKEKAKTD